jgi:hypothetical protein
MTPSNRMRNERQLALVGLSALAVACSTGEPRKEFSARAQDGSLVTATVQYRKGGCTEEKKPVDCYYYVATLTPKGRFDPSLSTPTPNVYRRVDSQAVALLARIDTARARAKAARDTIGQADVNAYISQKTNSLYTSECALLIAVGTPPGYAHLHLRFYDSEGFSLYRNTGLMSSGNSLAPGWNDVPDEEEQKDGRWRWQGRFPAANLPIEQFRKASVLKAELEPGCP